MGTIIATLASVGVVCAAGVGIASGLKWFHTFEIEIPTKKKNNNKKEGDVNERDNTKHIRKELRQRG